MTHEHGFQKIKNDLSFDCDGINVVLENVSGRTLFAGGASLFPDDRGFYCGQDAKIDKLIKENKLKVVEEHSAKPKPRKPKEEKSEETYATVADVDAEASVQLGSSEDDIAPSTEQS
jgi:hypothetical protein